jgi:hypothetical protein
VLHGPPISSSSEDFLKKSKSNHIVEDRERERERERVRERGKRIS